MQPHKHVGYRTAANSTSQPYFMEYTAFTHDHRPEPATDHTPLDDLMAAEIAVGLDTDGNDADTLAMRGIPPDALKTLLRFIIGSSTRMKSKRWQIATVRLAVVAHAIQLEDVGDLSFAELGKELGVTRASLSLYSVRLLDQFGISKFRSSKSRESREIFREKTLAYHKNKGHALTGKRISHKPFALLESTTNPPGKEFLAD